MNIVERYTGIQDVCKAIGSDGCHFLTLCSIAEQYLDKPIDFFGLVKHCLDTQWVTEDFYVNNDGTPILQYLTNKKWTRKEVAELPHIWYNDYSEAVYYNPRTKYHHFRRRAVDTLNHSITVAEGYIEKYYIYTVED